MTDHDTTPGTPVPDDDAQVTAAPQEGRGPVSGPLSEEVPLEGASTTDERRDDEGTRPESPVPDEALRADGDAARVAQPGDTVDDTENAVHGTETTDGEDDADHADAARTAAGAGHDEGTDAPGRRGRTGAAAAALVLIAASTALVAVAGSADLLPAARPQWSAAVPELSASATTLTLACPPGTVDPFDLSSAGAHELWTSPDIRPSSVTDAEGSQSTSPAGSADDQQSADTRTSVALTDEVGRLPLTVVTAAAGEAHTSLLPEAFTVTGEGGGELHGLGLAGCAVPSSDMWFAAGRTVVGEDLLLVLANPGTSASVATIGVIGATGPATETSPTVTVPAGATVVVNVGSYFPDQDRPAVHVTADGPGVAGWVQSSGMIGEVPAGTGLASSVRPELLTVLPGTTAGDTASLRIAAPTDSAAHVDVLVVTEEGTTPLPGGALDLDGNTTLDLDLEGIPAEASALIVRANTPVVAQTTSSTRGPAWEDSAQTWTARDITTTAGAIRGAQLPSASELTDDVTRILKATPLRPTSVSTDSGVSDVRVQLLLVAPLEGDDTSAEATQSGANGRGESIDVTLGEEKVDLVRGTIQRRELPEFGTTLRAATPIHVALLVEADTPTGALRAVLPIGTAGLPVQSALVSLGD